MGTQCERTERFRKLKMDASIIWGSPWLLTFSIQPDSGNGNGGVAIFFRHFQLMWRLDSEQVVSRATMFRKPTAPVHCAFSAAESLLQVSCVPEAILWLSPSA